LSEISGIAIGVSVGAGIVTAILAQIGDLGVSKFKRRFGVKDSSALIPGHGGLLDRTDGLLLTAPALAILLILAGESWFK
jgi:phosphatidate cytidylyltransferase